MHNLGQGLFELTKIANISSAFRMKILFFYKENIVIQKVDAL